MNVMLITHTPISNDVHTYIINTPAHMTTSLGHMIDTLAHMTTTLCHMTSHHMRNKGQYSCKVHGNISHQYSVSHEELVLITLMSPGDVEGHPIRIETSGDGPAHPAVVGR